MIAVSGAGVTSGSDAAGSEGAGSEGALTKGPFDYVLLFESSGMYRGEDIAALAGHLASGRLDAAWGSRRLSVRDIEESIKFRYQRSPLFGTISMFGSHMLSLACLMLYGRYISDTLSGVRAVRIDDVTSLDVPLAHPRFNQHLIGRLLRRKAEILEIPVQFFPISPERVHRTTVWDGFRALRALLSARVAPLPAPRQTAPALDPDKRSTDPVISR